MRSSRSPLGLSSADWHTTAPSYAPLTNDPENRVYLSPDAKEEFLKAYLAFTGGQGVLTTS